MNIVSLKKLREDTQKYIDQVKQGHSFVVLKRSNPIFKISPVDENWEEVINFTEIKKEGVDIDNLIKKL